MTDRDDMEMRTWAWRAFEGEPGAGSVGDTIGDDLARAYSGLRQRQRRVVGAPSAGLATGAVAAVLAATAISPTGDDGRSDQDPAEPIGAIVPLDYGPLANGPDRDLVLQVCSDDGAPRAEESVATARVLNGPLGLTPVMVGAAEADNPAMVCGYSSGTDVVGDLPTPTAEHPIVPVLVRGPDVMEQIGDPGYWSTGGVYAVADTVDRVEVRVTGAGGDEPWRSATAHDGFVIWSTWFNPDEYAAGEQLQVEWRAYDTDGNVIDPALLPERSRTISAPGPMQPDYAEVRDLLFEVAVEHLDPNGEHVSIDPGRSGTANGSQWLSIAADFEWRNPGSPGVGAVSVSIENGTGDEADSVDAMCGSGAYDCERRQLDGGGFAWVIDGRGGYFRVVHTQPDGETVAVSVLPEASWFDDEPAADMGIAVDDVLSLVADERLNMPG
jgi:hypothetical protein